MNIHTIDSGKFFRKVSRSILTHSDEFEVIQLTLNFALGVERLLKGILFDINPTFILIQPDFKNSLPVLYPDQLIGEKSSHKDSISSSSGDVITFKNSLLRANMVSETSHKNRNLLFYLSEARDIIVHHELAKLDVERLRLILNKDFYPLLDSFSTELKIRKNHFFDGAHIRLGKLSGSLQTDLNLKIEMLIKTHQEIWNSKKGQQGYVIKKEKVSQQILNSTNNRQIDCPVCQNDAILFLKPILEYSFYKNKEVTIGYSVERLECRFCKLKLSDGNILDTFKIALPKSNPILKCQLCNSELEEITDSGMCIDCDEYYGTEA